MAPTSRMIASFINGGPRAVSMKWSAAMRHEFPQWVTSGGLGPTLQRQVDPRQRTPPTATVASGPGQRTNPLAREGAARGSERVAGIALSSATTAPLVKADNLARARKLLDVAPPAPEPRDAASDPATPNPCPCCGSAMRISALELSKNSWLLALKCSRAGIRLG
jgi:hypothetical protein